ncbi:MAG: hypothetical protein RLY31_768 [Bacteroidota bacterium]
MVRVAAQHTVGLLRYDPSAAYEGYNLIYPHNQPHVYLLNNCGEVVHRWEDEANYRPGNTAYLLPDGKLVKTKRKSNVSMDPIWAGGGGATMEIREWDNTLVWSFEMNNDTQRLHHDFAITPQGTLLLLAWEKKSRAAAIQAGRDTSLLPDDELWPEFLVEINPATDEIVWEWHLWDHLVQEFDPTKDNFGAVSEHPELLDINFTTNNGGRDWLHANSVDFNPELNQIMLGTPFLSEVYLIDHTTTTAQAAGHAGGLGGRGGDFLYRWGNPQSYGAGAAADQQLFGHHAAHWIDDFLDFTHPYFGRIGVFNNQAGPDFSTVNVCSPVWDMYDWEYPIPPGTAWSPAGFDLTLTHPEPTAMYSEGLSSAQFLPNGNVLILSGRQGYAFELTPDNEIVWEYVTPLKGGQPVPQGTLLAANDNLTFRMDRYPADFSGFEGRDLSPIGWIELNPDSQFCGNILPSFEAVRDVAVTLSPNPARDRVTISWKAGIWADLSVYDLFGRPVYGPEKLTGGQTYLDVSAWQPGTYFVRVDGGAPKVLLLQR